MHDFINKGKHIFPTLFSEASIKRGGPSKIMLSPSSFSMISFSQRIGNAGRVSIRGRMTRSFEQPESKIDRVLQKARSVKAKKIV